MGLPWSLILPCSVLGRTDSYNGLVYLKSHRTGRWIRCHAEHVRWATEREVFDNNFRQSKYRRMRAEELIYLDESKLHHLARDIVPPGSQI